MSTFKSIFNSYVSSKLRGQHCAIPYYLYIFFYRFSVVLVQIILRYEGDFDTKGVIHYLGFNAGVSMWLNPAQVPSSGVKVTSCDGNGRGDPENILEYFTPGNSSTRSG